jgi:hypothetical protein
MLATAGKGTNMTFPLYKLQPMLYAKDLQLKRFMNAHSGELTSLHKNILKTQSLAVYDGSKQGSCRGKHFEIQ